MRSSTETIIGAMKILSHDIYCEDGVATAAIAEAADRLEEIAAENKKLKIQLQEANDYADRLVEHKDMICLPADLANLRKANTHFAIENEELKRELDDTKWSLDEARKNAGELIVSLDKENSLILEQRDRLAKALSDVTNSQDSTSMYRIAKQVLATLNQPEP